MPNLRGKTWTTTTPANVGDAQYWEDHLISDAVAAKAASSVQSVNNTTPDAQGNVDVVALPDGGTVGQVLTKQSSADGDADWEDPASSGHTIEDEDGNTMPYQSTLQFENAEVTNDSVNNKTIVDCKGSKGDAATITVGTVTTLPAGSDATVTNSGTSSDAVFDFGIPKGADGAGAVDSVNGYTGVVVLDASDVGALPDSTTIPTKTSELDNDSGFVTSSAIPTSLSELSSDTTHRLVTDAEKTAWNAKVSESLLKSTVGWTGKNLLPNNATSQTINGVTFTVNADKSVTVNGTATANAQFTLFDGYIANDNKDIILSGSPANGSQSAHKLSTWNYDKSRAFNDYGEGVLIPASSHFQVSITIYSGYTANNLVFYPMFRDASITDDTYEPYHESVEKEVEQIYADNGVLGAKNLVENIAVSATARGVTRTVNSDGSITLDGTNSVSGPAVIELNSGFELEAGTYILSGTPVGAWVNNAGFRLQLYDFINSVQIATDEGSGKTFTLSEKKTLRTRIWFSDGASISNKTFYPMLRLASDPDDTYVPYAMTNRELTDAVSVEPLNIVLSASDKATKLREDSRRCGHVVSIRIQIQVTAEIANNTEIFRLNGLPHTGYGIAILGQTNTGEIIPLMISSSGSNFVASCRKTIPTGYYAISYTYII